jgi:hypothetical protein
MKRKFEEMGIRCTLKWSAKVFENYWDNSGLEMTFIPDWQQLDLISSYPKVFKRYDELKFYSSLEVDQGNSMSNEEALRWLNEFCK